MDQRREGHHQPARRDAGAEPDTRQGGARLTAAAVDGAEPEDDHAVGGGGAVVTGDGREVEGRDPATGDTLWSYARDLELCGVTSVYNYAVAVYPDGRGCGQVSTIDAQTGHARAEPHSYADPEVALSSDGTTVLSAGDSRLEMWRSDMVRMLSYGALDARIKPGVPASPMCRLVSAEASSARRVGAGGVPGPARSAADAAAARRTRRTPPT